MKEFFSTFYFLLFHIPLSAATLHAILVGDTVAIGIQDSIKNDIHHMSQEMKTIESYTDLTLSLITLTGAQATTEELRAQVDRMTLQNDDCVLFYFAGHGYRTPSMGAAYLWPNPFLSYEGVGLNVMALVELIQAKGPRLLICMTDCCNNILSDAHAPPVSFLRNFSPERARTNYKILFQETKGLILATSSKIGRYSYGLSSGGVYTSLFLEILREETGKEHFFGWRQILDRVGHELDQLQSPIYTILP